MKEEDVAKILDGENSEGHANLTVEEFSEKEVINKVLQARAAHQERQSAKKHTSETKSSIETDAHNKLSLIKKTNSDALRSPNLSHAFELYKGIRENYLDSGTSHLLPFFPKSSRCRSEITTVDDDTSLTYEVEHNNLKFLYTAVPIRVEEKDSVREIYCYPSTDCELVFNAIKDMIRSRTITSEEISGSLYAFFFILDIRDYLKSKKQTRSHTQIMRALEILSQSKTKVTFIDPNNKDRFASAYISYFDEVNVYSDGQISRKDGTSYKAAYRVKLSGIHTCDILTGQYREIEEKILMKSGKSSSLYKQLIQEMNHYFLNAEATDPNKRTRFVTSLSNLLFFSGFDKDFIQSTGRRNIAEIRELLVQAEVIDDKSDLSFKLVPKPGHDIVPNSKSEKGTFDFMISVTPSLRYGQSQKEMNGRFKVRQDKILGRDNSQ